MSHKILVTGGNGQLGTELKKRLPSALFADVADLDITDMGAVQAYVAQHGVDTIVNCAAYTAVDKAEEDSAAAYRVNVTGPENLAKTGCKMVHISTDYVFDGLGHKPYEPDDETKPISVYGKTKREGEKAVLANAQNAVVIRTAWLYSAYGNNFVKTMRRLGAEKEQINVVDDQIGTPTYAGDLAAAIVHILPQLQESCRGIYHYTNEGVCSWYDFAHEIMALSGLKCRVNPIPGSAYPTKAKRPFYSVLGKTKIKETFGLQIPYWKQSLQDCLESLK